MSEEEFDQDRLWALYEGIEYATTQATVFDPDNNEDLLKEQASKIVVEGDGRVHVYPEKVPGSSWTREELAEMLRLYFSVVGRPQDN